MLRIIFFLLISITSAQFSSGQISRRKRSPEDTLCSRIIRPAGYPCTEQTVKTKDGYLLALQRVSSPGGDRRVKPPVLLVHGLFAGGETWFLDLKEESLGFILADEGFDVWVANLRATNWSYGHLSLSDKDKRFWNWSWQDIAMNDLPAILQHIYSATKSKINIIGHSQGTPTSLAALTQPNVAEMVQAAALLCPISYMNHITSPILNTMVSLHLDEIISGAGINEITLKGDLVLKLLMSLCDADLNCVNLLDSSIGKNCCLNSSRMNYHFENSQPTSSKNFGHFFQLIRGGRFSKFNYGIFENQKIYGKATPPEFNLSAIPKSLPIWMGYGGNDALADLADVRHTIKNLPSKPQELYLENYGHLDFVWSIKGKEDVFNPLIGFFRSLGQSL